MTTLEKLHNKQRRYRELTEQIDALEDERTPLGKEIRQLAEEARKEVDDTLLLIEKHNPSKFAYPTEG